MSNRAHWFAFAFVVALAAFARLYALDTLAPGLKYDAASNGMTILGMLYDGARPFYVNAMGAPEALILYLQAITVWMFGPTTASLRVVTALGGVLSVIALYGCAYEFTRDRRVALAAALALAGSLELMTVARYGIRFVLVTLFEAAALYCFARGWRTGSWRAFALGGIVIGANVYVYLAAVFVPIGIAMLWAFAFLFDRARWRARVKPMMLLWVIAAIVALPRILFHVLYPHVALARVNQVNLFQNPNASNLGWINLVLERFIAYAKMFGVEWQGASFRQPLLDPILFAFFVIGAIVILVRWKRIESFWAIIMLGVMLLPDLLAADEPTPNKGRIIGIMPPVFFFVGVGAGALVERFKSRAIIAMVSALLLFSAANSLNAYFVQRIAASPANQEFDDFNVSRVEVAEATWVNRQTDPVFVPLNEFARSPVRYLSGARAPRLRSALDANGALVPPAAPARAWVLLPESLERGRSEGRLYVHNPAAYVLITDGTVYLMPPTRANASTVESQLQTRAPDETIDDMRGARAARAFRVDPRVVFQFESVGTTPRAQFTQNLVLVSAAIGEKRVQPGETISLSLFWRALQRTSTDYTVFIHLLDSNEEVTTSADIFPALGAYPTYLWKTDEIIPTHHPIKVPARTRPGKYHIEIGLYDLEQNRLDVLDAQGRPSDNRVIVGALKIAPRVATTFAPSHAQRADFNGVIALTGFDLPRVASAGAPIEIALYWQAISEMERDYTVFVHLLDANGNIIAQADHQPQSGAYPTSIWDAGEAVRDPFALALPSELSPGKYTLRVGWYDLQTGARLRLRDTNDDALVLDTALEVTR
ncbi:MAG: glycosyltransferase family 39 protein [Chloroflexi bacterium]|nr:glycosyltransferase family 39 protein [Chloroflexota bacterium]